MEQEAQEKTSKNTPLVSDTEKIIKLLNSGDRESKQQICLTDKRLYYCTEEGGTLNNTIIDLTSVDSVKIDQIEEKHSANGLLILSLLLVIVGIAIAVGIHVAGLVAVGFGVLLLFIAMVLSRSKFFLALTVTAHGAVHNIPIDFVSPKDCHELQKLILLNKEKAE